MSTDGIPDEKRGRGGRSSFLSRAATRRASADRLPQDVAVVDGRGGGDRRQDLNHVSSGSKLLVIAAASFTANSAA
jgi:hypothetical protein